MMEYGKRKSIPVVTCPRCGLSHAKPEDWGNVESQRTWECRCGTFGSDGKWVQRLTDTPDHWHEPTISYPEDERMDSLNFLLDHEQGVAIPVCPYHGTRMSPGDWLRLRTYVDQFFALTATASFDTEILFTKLERRSEPTERLPRWGWIYILRGESGHHKIGRTKSVSARHEALATQAPYAIELIHSFECDDMRAAEKALHAKYAEKRSVGEWFDLTTEDVAWLLSLNEWPTE